MSKGSWRRPAAVDARTLAERWDAINWNVDNDDPPDPPIPDDGYPNRGDDVREVSRRWD